MYNGITSTNSAPLDAGNLDNVTIRESARRVRVDQRVPVAGTVEVLTCCLRVRTSSDHMSEAEL
jgi:hypothetical protein